MKNNLTNFEVNEISHHEIKNVAEVLTKWQEDNNFNRFLKEQPANIEGNIEFLQKKMSGKLVIAKKIEFSGKIIGILLLHSFDDKENSLEESIRIAPDFQRKGIGTIIKKTIFNEVLSNGIDKIISWHSSWNKGTFFTNKKCGGKIVNFVENQTFLPNIGKITDDFKWEISEILDGEKENIENISILGDKDKITFGLRKHGFIL